VHSQWPTALEADGTAPPNIFLIADGDEHVRRQAMYQLQVGVQLKDRGYEPVSFQMPLVGPKTRITVPIVMTDPAGVQTVVYTQSEEWTPERLLDLRNWLVQLDEAGRPPIVVASRVASPPIKPLPDVTLLHLPYATLEGAPGSPAGPAAPKAMNATSTLLLPCLKPFAWDGRGDTVCRPLWDGQQSDQMPWVAIGFDRPHTFEFIDATRLEAAKTSRQALETRALANLQARPAEWKPMIVRIKEDDELQMLLCTGDYFSAERILDPDFMMRAQQALTATAIVVGVPRRGVMFATANQSPQHLMAFAAAVAAQYARAESPEISPLLFGMKDGVILGIAQTMVPAPAAAAPARASGSPEGDGAESDPEAPYISTITVQNKRGKEDVHLLAGGPDGQRLAKAIETAFGHVLKAQMQRKEFSGHIHLVVLPMMPPAERTHLTATIKHLRGICADLSTGDEPYRLTVTFKREDAAFAEPPAAATAPAPIQSRGRSRIAYTLAAIVALAISSYYLAPAAETFPDGVDFGERHLERATHWTRDGVSGAVYVAPGEKLPAAPLQVGLMTSTVHPTAADLDAWIRHEYERSTTTQFYDSGPGEVSCKAGMTSYRNDARAFMAVQVCRTVEGKAACAESDESMPDSVTAHCVNGPSSCFADACDMRTRADVAALAVLVLQVLTKR
jgi:hypothetical protein